MSSVFTNTSAQVNFADSVDYEIINTTEGVARAAEELSSELLLAVDTENSTIDPHNGWPILLQVGTSDKCFVFEGWHSKEATGRDVDFSPLKELLESPDILKVFFQAKYDWKWIYRHYGIKVRNLFCCQVAERLLTVGLPNARRRPSLREVVLKYLGIELKKEARSGFIDRDPIEDPITDSENAYSGADVVLLPDIYYQQMELLREHDIHLAMAMENRALPALAKAEVAGVIVDQERWKDLVGEAVVKHREISARVYKHFESVMPQKTLFGLPTFNIGSQPQLLKNLKRLGFKLDDTDEGTLKRYKNKHAVFPQLIKWRGFQKVVSSYGSKFLAKINKNTGRLHGQFNQVMADTGRMSSSNPNLQQVPGFDPDDDDSLDFRSCFIAKPGYKLVTADFSQQELRILADMSGDPTFRKAYLERDEDGNTLDVHKYTASVIFEVPYKEVTPNQRKKAKTLNFFLVFGGGAYSLADTLKCTEEEAQDIIDDYFKRYSHIKRFLDNCASSAVYNGYATTISGRKRFLTLPSPDDPMFRRAKSSIKRRGKNTPIQGSGADVTKMALAFLFERLERENYDATVLMVVHDEFVVEVREDQAEEVARVVEEEMVRGFSHFFATIPMVVDANIGDTWEK